MPDLTHSEFGKAIASKILIIHQEIGIFFSRLRKRFKKCCVKNTVSTFKHDAEGGE